jgi:hypothetical protein
VLGAGSQTLNVTFTPTDTTDYNTATASVQLTVNKATPVITWATPSAITYGTALSATQLNATTAVAGAFVYSPVSGTVLSAGSQTLNVTFTPTDTTDYNTATASVQLTVNKATPAITWATPSAITYGTPLSSTQLNATSPVAGTFVYNPVSGTVLGAGSQTLNVTFTPTDTTDYNTATASVQLTVNKATPAITWATPSAITYGTPLSATQLNATTAVAGAFVYSPVSGTVLSAGSQTLNVTFTPTDTTDYNTASASVQLTVNKATPVITWATPSAITYGTALSSTQLNATSPVAGTFVYNPVSGAVLGVGPQTLNVTLTPTDSTDYNSATKSVQLTVNAASQTLTFAPIPQHTYGDPAFSVWATSPSTGAVTYSVASGPASVISTSGLVTLTGAGIVKLNASQAATSNYGALTATTQFTVLQQASTTAISSSATSLTPMQALTLTALVAPTVNGSVTPTGTVTFFDGSTSPATQLGSAVAVTNGQAQLANVSLLSGPHVLYAVYSSDTNYLASSSSASAVNVTVAPEDFNFTLDGNVMQSVVPGTAAVFNFTLTPAYDKYPGPLVFTVTGLPPGATYTVTPSTITASTGPQNVTVTINTPVALSMRSVSHNASWALALLLPMLFLRRSRKQLARVAAMVLLLSAGAFTLTGCGTSPNGYFGQQVKTYTVTVTGTCGNISHSSSVTLQVQ